MKHLWIYQILLVLTLLITPSIYVSARNIDIRDHISGRILLDVENSGEAWYVYPPTGERYFLNRPADAFKIMQDLGLGISNANLNLIPEAGSSFEGDLELRKRLAGLILLQVESRGEAFYVHPKTQQRHFLGRPADAFKIMREQSLGISEADLIDVPIALEPTPGVFYDVAFTAQAPFAEWGDLRQQEGCEEASVFMAMHWLRGTSFLPEDARTAILDMSEFQKQQWGEFVDTSALDTINRLFKAYYNYDSVEYRENINTSDIKLALQDNSIVIIPVDGKAIQNPYFTNAGPERHMIVVTGFDEARNEFITNEPGTYRGHNYRYSQSVIEQSLRDYVSGRYVPIPADAGTAMIVVKKN